ASLARVMPVHGPRNFASTSGGAARSPLESAQRTKARSGALAAQRPADHLVEQARADVAVPLVALGAGRDLAEVEADAGAAALHHSGDQLARLVEAQPAWYRCSGMRAEAGLEPVDVEGEVDVLGQVAHDAVDLLLPRRAREALARQRMVEVGDDAAAALLDVEVLAAAEVPHPHLHQLRHLGDTLHHVVEDRGVAMGEALVGLPQVGMGVHVEDAHARMALGVRADRAEGYRVIAAQHADDLALVEPARDL